MNIFSKKFHKPSLWKPILNKTRRAYTWKPHTSVKSTSSKLWLGFLLGISTLHELRRFNQQTYCAEENKTETAPQEPEDVTREEKISLLKLITSYEIGVSTDFREGVIREVKVMHEGKELTVIVTRVQGQLFASGAFCTYDDKTPLKDGVIFNDKIYAPIYGSAYNVTTGTVEYGPAIDNLAIFFIREHEGKVTLGVPKYPPKKVRPISSPRDYNDLRKVVIIGSGIAAFTCAETLRQTGFTGEIKMVSRDTRLPYDKTKLSKSFKDIHYEDLTLRPEEFYDDVGIECMFGREIKTINNKHGSPHIELEDGLKLEYDALFIATGAEPEFRDIPGLKDQDNVTTLTGIEDHRKIKEYLQKSKHVTVIGASLWSLETVATIRTEYPNITVHVVDENETLSIDDKLGREAADVIINLHKANGVKFTFAKNVEKFNGNDEIINEVELEDETKIQTDLVLLFPNSVLANTEVLFDGENIDNMEFDDEARIKVDFNQRTDHKRIFAAGDCSAGMYFAQAKRFACDNWQVAFHGGMIAAYNILALDIPNAVVPFTYTKQYNNYFNYSGYAAYYNETFVDGDLNSLDFVVYYSFMGTVLAAFGSEKRRRDMLVINEAFRLSLMPELSDLRDGTQNVRSIEKRIRDAKRSGCFKDLINDVRFQPKPDEVVWTQREKSNEYYNFWEQGKQHMGANIVPETD